MIAMMPRSVRETMSASSAPTPAEGSVERIVIGMDVALVQHAQHDVHGDDRRQDQQQRVVERGLERERRALEARLHAGRQADLPFRGANRIHRVAQRGAGREIERNGRRRKLAEMIDDQRRGCSTIRATLLSLTCAAGWVFGPSEPLQRTAC